MARVTGRSLDNLNVESPMSTRAPLSASSIEGDARTDETAASGHEDG